MTSVVELDIGDRLMETLGIEWVGGKVAFGTHKQPQSGKKIEGLWFGQKVVGLDLSTASWLLNGPVSKAREEALDALRVMVEKVTMVVTTPSNGDTVTAPAGGVYATLPSAFSVMPMTMLEAKAAPAIALRDATRLYTPVSGTAKGSRYFLVAANYWVRVAARWKGSSLAVRVESGAGHTFNPPMEELLTSVGFEKKWDHWSAHVTAEDDVLVRKTLGSLLFGLGVKWVTPMPYLARLRDLSK